MLVKCDEAYGGCGFIFGLRPKDVEGERHIQCPECQQFKDNPFFLCSLHQDHILDPYLLLF